MMRTTTTMLRIKMIMKLMESNKTPPAGNGDENKAVLCLGGGVIYRHRHHCDVLGENMFFR